MATEERGRPSGGGWLGRAGKAFARRWRLNWGATLLITLAAVGTVISGVTTFGGLWQFTGDSGSGGVLAFGMTVVIQGLLLVLGFMLGGAIISSVDGFSRSSRAGRRPLIAVMLLTPLVVASAATSIFFSANTFFYGLVNFKKSETVQDGGGGSVEIGYLDQLAREHVFDGLSDITGRISGQIESERDAGWNALRGGAGWRAFETTMKALSAEANRDYDRIFDSYQRKLSANAGERETAAAKAEKLGETYNDNAQRLKKIDDAIAEAEGALAKLTAPGTTYAELKAEIASRSEVVRKQQIEMDKQEGGIDDEGKKTRVPGKGPLWTIAKGFRDEAQKALDAIEPRFNELQDQADVLNQRLESLSVERKSLRGAVESSQAAAKSAEADLALRFAKSPQEALADRQEIDELIERISRDLAQFANQTPLAAAGADDPPAAVVVEAGDAAATAAEGVDDSVPGAISAAERSTLDRLSASCNSLKVLLSRVSAGAGDAADWGAHYQCDYGAIATDVATLRRLNAGQLAFKAACGAIAQDPSLIDANAAQLLNKGRVCLEKSGLAVVSKLPFRKELTDYQRQDVGALHPFLRTVNSVFRYGDRVGVIALAIATMLDVLIIVVTLLAAFKSRRAMDALGGGVSGGDLVAALEADDAPDDRDSVGIRKIKSFLRATETVDPSEVGSTRYIERIRLSERPDLSPEEKSDVLDVVRMLAASSSEEQPKVIILEPQVEPPEGHDVGDYRTYYIALEAIIDFKQELNAVQGPLDAASTVVASERASSPQRPAPRAEQNAVPPYRDGVWRAASSRPAASASHVDDDDAISFGRRWWPTLATPRGDAAAPEPKASMARREPEADGARGGAERPRRSPIRGRTG